jgi:hypothetical protein
MNITKSLTLALSIAAASLSHAATGPITNFGSSALTDDGWSYVGSTLSGTEGLGFLLYGEPISNDFTGATQITITANVAGAANAPANGFTFLLLDGQDDSATAIFNWSDFIGGATVSADLVNISSGFDFGAVIGWNLVGGSSNAAINVVLSTALATAPSVIPEPSSYAALAGLAALGLVAARRRRSA